MDTEVDVPNADLILIPGMYAEVTLTLSRRSSVLTIPITAVDLEAEAAAQNGAPGAPDMGRVMVITPTSRVESPQRSSWAWKPPIKWKFAPA